MASHCVSETRPPSFLSSSAFCRHRWWKSARTIRLAGRSDATAASHHPLDTGAEESLQRSFAALASGSIEEAVPLVIEGRLINARKLSQGIVWFDFSDLCEGPRSQNDYIELATLYHTVLVSNIPILDGHKEDAARRFISLVDEFYDHGVKLIASAAASIHELYQGQRLRFEFARTESRLLEMQSMDYLAGSHTHGDDASR